jgi:hypothetical protein
MMMEIAAGFISSDKDAQISNSNYFTFIYHHLPKKFFLLATKLFSGFGGILMVGTSTIASTGACLTEPR